MLSVLFVGLGGFVGAVARYGLYVALRARAGEAFPVATLAVNVLGCLAIGVFLGVARSHPGWNESTRLLVVVGGLGSFTTFSTFGHDTAELIARGATGAALASVALNLGLGLAAVWVGSRWAV